MKTPAVASLRHLTRLAALLAGLALGCGGGAADPGDPDAGTPPPAASFTLSVATAKLPVLTGANATVAVTVTREAGFTGAIALAPVGLPAGATGTFAPATLADGETQATLTVTAAADAPHSLPTAVEVKGTSGDTVATKPLTVTVYGPPGSLDTSFGGGKVVIPAGASDDYAYAMALQADGKVIVVGRAAEHRGDFAVLRLERDGALDATFGAGGKVLTDFAGQSETALAVAVQADGKIVVAGTTTVTDSGQDFALARYNSRRLARHRLRHRRHGHDRVQRRLRHRLRARCSRPTARSSSAATPARARAAPASTSRSPATTPTARSTPASAPAARRSPAWRSSAAATRSTR